jgi:hypothetical protein
VTKLAKKQERIINHAHKLHKIFPASASIRPATLYGLLAQLEKEASKLAEDYCTRPMAVGEYERREKRIMQGVANLLDHGAERINVFLNGDPRGYALKIRDTDVRARKLDIHTDWGGYGIIAPDFNEE